MIVSRRRALAAAGAFAAWPAEAQAPTPPAANQTRVLVTTDHGAFAVALASEQAPITCANFLRYVDERRYDASAIFRASRAPGAPTGAPPTGLIEGGLQNDPKRLLPPIAHEPTTQTGLRHVDGTISMARNAPGTATSDFFVCVGPASYLDARPEADGDNLGYAAFGQVVEGMEVVRAILALPTPGVARNPVMQGQILDPPVAIVSMRRV